MPEIGTSGAMSGDGKRSDAAWPQATAPVLDSTNGHQGLDRRALADDRKAGGVRPSWLLRAGDGLMLKACGKQFPWFTFKLEV
jgi:hypothetical protein